VNYILTIDTSFSQSCLALFKNKEMLEEVFLSGSPRDNDSLLFRLEDLLTRHQLTLKDIEGIAIAIGPGSYTGLRLSIAAVKGIALVTKCTIKALSVFDIFIQQYKSENPVAKGELLSVIDTSKGDFYCQRYSQNFTAKGEPFFAKLDQLQDLLKNEPALAFVGQIQPLGTSGLLINFPSARSMVELYFDPNCQNTSTTTLEPLYMRQTGFVKLKENPE
jgi:tRNA threonylcarbamoyladenosine biosynthesis protein TsaB